jgi:hypothetical protein
LSSHGYSSVKTKKPQVKENVLNVAILLF